MAPTSSTTTRSERPAVYFHVEFGLSWTPSKHAPRNRQITYMSRSMRDRATQFPRHLPPANTNFLAAPVTYTHPYPQYQYQHAAVPAQQQQTVFENQPQSWARQRDAVMVPWEYYQWPQNYQQQAQAQVQDEQEEGERSSRSQSRGSHERGRSAPPPFNDSPWDAEPEPMGATALPRGGESSRRPEIWKALPATPDRFRLGEEGMPWSAQGYPTGWVEDAQGEGSDMAESSRRRDMDDRERGQAREMQSLAAAMMTVDNGFEDQWWNQGPRLVNVAGDLMTPGAAAQFPRRQISRQVSRQGSAVWTLSDEGEQLPLPPVNPFSDENSTSSRLDMVSPISNFSSPVSSFQGLRRSLTTRSDELHM